MTASLCFGALVVCLLVGCIDSVLNQGLWNAWLLRSFVILQGPPGVHVPGRGPLVCSKLLILQSKLLWTRGMKWLPRGHVTGPFQNQVPGAFIISWACHTTVSQAPIPLHNALKALYICVYHYYYYSLNTFGPIKFTFAHFLKQPCPRNKYTYKITGFRCSMSPTQCPLN